MKLYAPQEYRPQANRLYRKLATAIRRALPLCEIEHIGSSSISGLWSKGDLDIFVCVPKSEMRQAVSALESLGFTTKRGTLHTSELHPFVAHGLELDVGIQLVAEGSAFEFFLHFRDRLRRSATLRHEYNELKKRLILRNVSESEYRSEKSSFIESVLASPSLQKTAVKR